MYGEIYAAVMINYDWTYTDIQSQSHLFSGLSRASDGLCPPGDVLDFEGHSLSGYRLVVTNATHAEVYDPSGALVYSN